VGDPDAPNRTIQIDALTDVQLVEDAIERAQAQVSAAPPPLPSRRAPQSPEPSQGRKIGLMLIAIVAGLGFAFGVIHFLFPAPTPQPPPVRQIRLDDELVIHAGQ
jgi:hypothetical protein